MLPQRMRLRNVHTCINLMNGFLFLQQIENVLQDFSGNFVLCDYGSCTTVVMDPKEVKHYYRMLP